MKRIMAASLCLCAFVACGGDSAPSTTPPVAATPTPPSPAPEPEPLGVPSGLRIAASGEDFIEWTWNEVEGADGYDVQFSSNEAFTSEDEIIARTEEQLSYRREGLTGGVNAYLRVRSASGSGDDRITSDWSAVSVGTTEQAPSAPNTLFGAGTWLVGSEIEPGRYFTNPGRGCYWERLSGLGGTSDDRIANDFVSGGGRQLVEVARDDVGFSNDADCGTWRSIGRSTLGLPGGTMASETIEANRLLYEAHRGRRRPH